MSTTALIGLKTPTGITSIYVHYDGGLWKTGVGETLLNNYKTLSKIRKLIAMGDCSQLNPTIENSVFYHRDRQEDFDATKAETYTQAEWQELVDSQSQDFFYLYDKKWNLCSGEKVFDLAQVIESEQLAIAV